LKQYHAEKRMYKCDTCGRDYKWIDSLHKHMKVHKDEQPKLSLYQLREENEAMIVNEEHIEMEHQEADEPTSELWKPFTYSDFFLFLWMFETLLE